MVTPLAASSLSSPSRLLAELGKRSGGSDEPPLEDLLESARRAQGGAAAAPPADRLEVFPEPGFVVKTHNDQGQKVFINVCGSSKMPLPPGWTRGGSEVPAEVKQHLERGQGGEAPPSMRFPLSMGAARIDMDHRGEACLVIDCILSGKLLEACAAYRPLKVFLVGLAIGMAQQQTGLELDPRYRLPKMRYKGGNTPPPQFIRLDPRLAREGLGSTGSITEAADGSSSSGTAGGELTGAPGGKPLISEVLEDQEGGEEGGVPAFALLANKRQQRQRGTAAVPAAAEAHQRQKPGARGHVAAATAAPKGTSAQAKAAAQQRQDQGSEAQGSLLQRLQPSSIEYEGQPASTALITVPLPPAAAAAAARDPGSLQACVCAEAVRVQVPGCQHLDVKLPFAVSAAGASAELAAPAKEGGSSALVLRLPYRPFASVLEELRQAAAAAEGRTASAELGSGRHSGLMELD